VAKKGSKTFLRCARLIETKAVEHARSLGCQAVCCGHTHLPIANRTGDVHYFNSGCWTELPCSYLTVAGGEVEIHSFSEEVAKADGTLAPARV
jgi:UDP-2,3-diacylglucosamine pyrophosphatase LpxH